MKIALTIAWLALFAMATLVLGQHTNRLQTLENLMVHSVHLPKEHWVCTDVLRDGDGIVECKTWENING